MNWNRSQQSIKVLLILYLLANFTYENIFAEGTRVKTFVVLNKKSKAFSNCDALEEQLSQSVDRSNENKDNEVSLNPDTL